MITLLLVLSCFSIAGGIHLWFSKTKLFIAGPWIINNALFVIIAILEPGFCVSMFYIGIGLYITAYHFHKNHLNRTCYVLIGLCVTEVVFTNALKFLDLPTISNNITLVKTNALVFMFIPGYFQITKLLSQSKHLVSNYYSNLNFDLYNWLKNILYFAFFNGVFCITIVFLHMWVKQITFSFEFILSAILITNAYLYYLCYIKYVPQFKICLLSHQPKTPDRKLDKAEKLLNQLIELNRKVDEQKLYLESDLTLPKLASLLQVHPKLFSGMINQQYNLNFHEYITQKRIKLAKSKLIDSDFSNYTIVAIGLDSGFSSRSTFYSSFKKHVGCTPKQYQQFKQDQIHQQNQIVCS